jgi:hypothetical protein
MGLQIQPIAIAAADDLENAFSVMARIAPMLFLCYQIQRWVFRGKS